MASRNDVTGDVIQSKMNSDPYRDNWDKIFGNKKQDAPVVVDVDKSSDVIKKLNIKCEYFEDAAEIFESITGIAFENIDYVDDLVVYELIVSITCACDEDDLEFLEQLRVVVLYFLQTTKHEVFDKFYYQWIKDHTKDEQ